MWLFIPSNCVPESECLEKASELHSTISALNTEPFVTWSGKPVQPANLSRLWKRERSMRRLSGLTLSRSTAQRGVDTFIASLPGSHAKTCLSRGDARVSTVSAPDSSSTFSTSRMLAVRNSSFWRTCQASLLPPPPLWTKPKENSSSARLPASWASWPTAVGMRNACLFERPMSARIMNAHDGSASPGAWPTMDCNTATYSNGRFGPNIRERATNWATPDANALERTNRSDSPNAAVRPTLALAAANWATSKASETDRGVCPSEIARRSPGLLTQASTWATPTARDHKDGASSLENVEVNGLLGRQVLTTSLHPVHSTIDGRELSPTGRTLRQRLNPAFACWLMGWPIWWTNPAITNSVKLETALWHSKLRSRLSRLLGEPESFEEAA